MYEHKIQYSIHEFIALTFKCIYYAILCKIIYTDAYLDICIDRLS